LVNFSLERVADRGLGLPALHFVADGLHQVRLAHTHAAIKEKRVVGLGGILRDRLSGGAGELVAVADDEGVERIARIQLRDAVPIETPLRNRRCRRARKAAVVPHGCRRWVVVGSNELYIREPELKVVHRFLDQVSVFIADVAELIRGHAHKNNSAVRVAVTGRLQPRVVGVAIDFFLKRFQDSHPGIGRRGRNGRRRGCHKWSKTPTEFLTARADYLLSETVV